jgi:acetyl-CoA/propionyl-CoA carboxylase biotin carboxyl carrier protein
VREAVAAFGRGECFVERYLDRPRHVETQCLADAHGNVVVVSTRDCSLQRRYQKVVEEAPAPFLTEEQTAQLYAASKDIVREAEYVGAGTCEFLVAKDGLISFLEVNTRLQVEHPVSEEVTGIDLVREQFRIAEGEALDLRRPRAARALVRVPHQRRGPGRGFLPAPGTVTAFVAPSGPGVRLDSGVEAGSVVGGAFDSLLAKLVVTGRDRAQALERARRALAEFEVEGMATALPFHRRSCRDPPSPTSPFRVHTRWIETEWDGRRAAVHRDAHRRAGLRAETVVVEVGGGGSRSCCRSGWARAVAGRRRPAASAGRRAVVAPVPPRRRRPRQPDAGDDREAGRRGRPAGRGRVTSSSCSRR